MLVRTRLWIASQGDGARAKLVNSRGRNHVGLGKDRSMLAEALHVALRETNREPIVLGFRLKQAGSEHLYRVNRKCRRGHLRYRSN
jgi:hypothetical protein